MAESRISSDAFAGMVRRMAAHLRMKHMVLLAIRDQRTLTRVAALYRKGVRCIHGIAPCCE